MMRYLLGNYRAGQVRLFAVVVLSTLAALAPIHLFRVIIDRALPSGDGHLLALIAAGLGLLLVVAALLDYARAVLARRIQEFFVADLRLQLMSHIMELPPEYFAAHPIGRLVNRVMHDVARFGMGIEWLLINPVVALSTVVLYTAYLLSIDPLLTGLALLPLPVFLFVTTRISKTLGVHRGVVVHATGTFSASVNEVLLGATEIQANGSYEREAHRLRTQHAALSDAGVREASLLARIAAVSGAYRDFVPVLIYGYGGLLALHGELSTGRLVAFAGAFGGLYLAVDTLIQYLPLYANVRDRYAELQKILDEPVVGAGRVTSEGAVQPVGGGVRLLGVDFEHRAGTKALQQLSLDIPPGQHVALIGRSGCGKSTLLNLVAGRLKPTTGELSSAGVPYQQLDRARRNQLISYVQQSPFLFSGTLRDNLLYGVADEQPLPSDDRLIELATKVGLAPDLLRLGLETCWPDATGGTLPALRSAIAARLGVTNEFAPWQADRSLRANLSPTSCDVDDAAMARDVARAIEAELAIGGMDDAVRRLGLSFDVGEHGSRLSGGQRQKVSIARAVLRRRPLLLLDEVTASLDETSTKIVLELLSTDLRDTTVIAITHELDTLPAFDRVIALRDGALAADAPPHELLSEPDRLGALIGHEAVVSA